MSVASPELRITLGRRAYRWPFRACLAALALGVLGLLSDVAVYGGVLVALAAAAWAFVIHRTRLVVTIGRKGLVLRRGAREVSVPAGSVCAMGIVWPVTDPVWTVWFDAEAAACVGAVVDIDDDAAPLLRDRSLPPGWLPAARTAVAEHLGAPWRVLDDAGKEVEPPPGNPLARADHVLLDGTGRFHDQRGGALLAVSCGRRTVVLRDRHAGRLLVVKRPALGRRVTRVFGADGALLGTLRGRDEPSFHARGGTFLGATRRVGDRHVVTGVDGRESASLRTATGEGDARLERSPSTPEPLRTLTLALPLVVRS
ncbi:hypothetical protein GCM10022254_10780 [Actinomadura meridiana]|uniref:Uncharacterized protein n=1 Tax=Actinomadura meridiana TaxID=559626 RepID=A0ABP8BUC3_9ACTN